MSTHFVACNVEQLSGNVLRVAFVGEGGVGSDGNADGRQMQAAVCAALAVYRPAALVIDLRGLEYRFGDWIGALALTALRALGPGRACVLTTGATAAALRPLWEGCNLQRVIPFARELSEALASLV